MEVYTSNIAIVRKTDANGRALSTLEDLRQSELRASMCSVKAVTHQKEIFGPERIQIAYYGFYAHGDGLRICFL